MIERSVDSVIEDSPSVVDRRSSLVQSLVKALEADSNWIPLYDATGKLEAPPTPDLEPELESVVVKIKQVPA